MSTLGTRVYNRIAMVIALTITMIVAWGVCQWLLTLDTYIPADYQALGFWGSVRFLYQPHLWARLYIPLGMAIVVAQWTVHIYYGTSPDCKWIGHWWRRIQNRRTLLRMQTQLRRLHGQ